MFERINVHGVIAFAVLISWASFVGVFGASLFEDIYKSNCIDLTLPLSVYAFLLGCAGLALFIISRVLYGGIRFTKKTLAPTTSSKLWYVAQSMVCFLCGVTTALAFANLRAANGTCDSYEPPVAILILVFVINTLNGLLSSEHFFQTIEVEINLDSAIEDLTFTHRSQMPEPNALYRTVEVQPKTD